MFTLEDIFKPNCERKVCCLYCFSEAKLMECPGSCVKNLVKCEDCFYNGQKFEEAKEIQEK